VLALAGGIGREGRRRGEVGGDRCGEYLDGPGEGFGELGGDLDDQGGGRGRVGVEAEDAAPAAGEGDPGGQVAVGGGVELAPGGPQPGECLRADGGLDRGGDAGGLGGLEDPGVFAGQQEGRRGGGLAGAGWFGAGGGEVGEDELGGAGAQPAAVAGAAGGLAGLDAGFLQLAGGLAPVRPALGGDADSGMGGVGALVGQRAPCPPLLRMSLCGWVSVTEGVVVT
jgi:hypothetical protein